MEMKDTMSLLYSLGDEMVWNAYLKSKQESNYTSPQELSSLENFIAEGRYLSLSQQFVQPDYHLPLPRKALISKKHTDKKRIIYFYPPDEHQMLKLLNHLIARKYDHRLSDACHSFRIGRSVKTVIRRIGQLENLEQKYSVKLDISSYGNSIPVEPLLEKTGKIIDDDPLLMDFISRMLRRSQAIYGSDLVHEPMGAMTGTPTVGFFENLYLKDVDDYFIQRGFAYFRYGDDILLLADSYEVQQQCLQQLTHMLVNDKGLKLNPDKISLTVPGETWEYLGVSYADGVYDLSRITIEKCKERIRRFARYLYREKRCRMGMGYEETVSIFLRRFNAIFFDIFENNEFSWSRWYFSVITTSKSLKAIDAYMQQYIRYLYSGRHNKGNYKITYAKMKEMGYRSLVHEYYEYLKTPPPQNSGLQKQKP